MQSKKLNPEVSYRHTPSDLPMLECSVGELLRKTAAHVPERLALASVPTDASQASLTWTYRELLASAEVMAQRLLMDFQPGDHLAVWASNKPEWVILQMGAALAGLVLVTLNPANRIEEMRYLLNKSAACGLFLDRKFRQLDNEAIVQILKPELPLLHTVVYFDQWDAYLTGPLAGVPYPEVAPESPALILFTSGTTGRPKAAVLTHRGVVNNPRYSLERYQLRDGAVWLNILPYFHVGGSVANTLACIVNRGTQAVMSEFLPEVMLRAISSFKANVVMGVPTMVHAMLEHPSFDTTDLSSLEIFITGGTTVAPELIKVIRQRFKSDVGVIFGQTEAGGIMCLTHRNDTEDRLCNTVGQPIGSYELKVVDAVDGSLLDIGKIGEICVRSPCVMQSYFDMPDKTSETLDDEGWIHTGDLGIMRPDGYVQITGRLKDMIIRGGENIYPREIEDILLTHPAVAQVAVVGVPDVKWGEQVAAAVVLRQGQVVEGGALASFLESRISKHKIPTYWSFLPSFPTNPTGKVQKFLLRTEILDSLKK